VIVACWSGLTSEWTAFCIIGKEANNIDEQAVDVKRPQMFVNESELREMILNMAYSDWSKRGFSKGTLHYLKNTATSGKPLTMNAHVVERLSLWV